MARRVRPRHGVRLAGVHAATRSATPLGPPLPLARAAPAPGSGCAGWRRLTVERHVLAKPLHVHATRRVAVADLQPGGPRMLQQVGYFFLVDLQEADGWVGGWVEGRWQGGESARRGGAAGTSAPGRCEPLLALSTRLLRRPGLSCAAELPLPGATVSQAGSQAGAAAHLHLTE